MIDKIIKATVLGIVLYIVYILVGMLVTALGIPAIVTLVIGILLALGFLAFVLKLFEISF